MTQENEFSILSLPQHDLLHSKWLGQLASSCGDAEACTTS